MTLDPEFWNKRYLDKNTPWDIGGVSPPLQSFLDQIKDTSARILIPGAGRAYEAVYLHNRGFTNIYVCDWAKDAFHLLTEKAPGFPEEHLLCADYFKLTGQFDFMLEQTFFCAIDPALRPEYVRQAYRLLKFGGVLAGVLFASEFDRSGPPFGGNPGEYRALFSQYFFMEEFEICKNSILPRAGNEVFFKLIKK